MTKLLNLVFRRLVVLIGVAVLIGYLGAYYRTQAYKTILADNLNVQNVIVHLVSSSSHSCHV
jgi:hypothetical protein